MDRLFTIVASRTAFAAGQPAAFMLALLIIIGWGISGPVFGWSDTWQLVVNTGTTIATFLMVFLIQNSQNRDAAAMQAKLDELIRAVHNARNDFVGIEHLTDHEIEAIRSALEDAVGSDHARHGQHQSIARLLKRR
jgi:low affinity Fe/Cu permease